MSLCDMERQAYLLKRFSDGYLDALLVMMYGFGTITIKYSNSITVFFIIINNNHHNN